MLNDYNKDCQDSLTYDSQSPQMTEFEQAILIRSILLPPELHQAQVLNLRLTLVERILLYKPLLELPKPRHELFLISKPVPEALPDCKKAKR